MSVRLFDRIVLVFCILSNLCLIVLADIEGEVLIYILEIRVTPIH